LEEVIECQCEFDKKNMMVKMCVIGGILRKVKIINIVLNIETMPLITKATGEPKIYQNLQKMRLKDLEILSVPNIQECKFMEKEEKLAPMVNYENFEKVGGNFKVKAA